MKLRLLGLGLASLLLAVWVGGQRESARDALSPVLDGLPGLPVWQPSGKDTPERLPEAPPADEIAAFVAGSAERFVAALPDRWQLALAEGRLLGPDGALALARGSGQAVSEPQRREVMLAVAGAVGSAARRNDFSGADSLIAALRPEEGAVAEVAAAAALLEARRTLWSRDRARAERIAATVVAIEAGLAVGDAPGLEAALAAARRLATDDPDHETAAQVETEVARRARAAWVAALDADDWPAIDRWSAWMARHLPQARSVDLAAATRAARERRAAPPPTVRH